MQRENLPLAKSLAWAANPPLPQSRQQPEKMGRKGVVPVRMSHGQSLMAKMVMSLIGVECLHNHRPDWLHGLEIDLFFPRLNLGFEFQGDQHYIAIKGAEALKSQQARDARKLELCEGRGISLIVVDAVHLNMGKLASLIYRANPAVKFHNTQSIAAELNREALKYAKILHEHYQSPTVFAPDSKERTQAMQGKMGRFNSLHLAPPAQGLPEREIKRTQRGYAPPSTWAKQRKSGQNNKLARLAAEKAQYNTKKRASQELELLKLIPAYWTKWSNIPNHKAKLRTAYALLAQGKVEIDESGNALKIRLAFS